MLKMEASIGRFSNTNRYILKGGNSDKVVFARLEKGLP